MSQTCRPSPRTPGPEWTVRQVVPRAEWEADTDRCPACGDVVDRRRPHYQVELDRERPAAETGTERSPAASKFTRERRLLSFCDEACATSWLDDGD